MKDRNYTLELADGTVMQLSQSGHLPHPDVKAFYLPSGSMPAFSSQNLPRARREADHERSRSGQQC